VIICIRPTIKTNICAAVTYNNNRPNKVNQATHCIARYSFRTRSFDDLSVPITKQIMFKTVGHNRHSYQNIKYIMLYDGKSITSSSQLVCRCVRNKKSLTCRAILFVSIIGYLIHVTFCYITRACVLVCTTLTGSVKADDFFKFS